MTNGSEHRDVWLRNLACGREFERSVRATWRAAGIWPTGEEQSVSTSGRKGYIDLWDDATGLLVLCELKDVNWESKADQRAALSAVQRHKNQVWKYLLAEGMPDDVQLILIYSRTPAQNGWAEGIESYLDQWSVNVIWWDSNPSEHWLQPNGDRQVIVGQFPAAGTATDKRETPDSRTKARIIERVDALVSPVRVAASRSSERRDR